MSCDFCGKEVTREYLGKELCELHYFQENPHRNGSKVLSRMIYSPPWKIKDRRDFLREIYKVTSLEVIESYLGRVGWYRRLQKMAMEEYLVGYGLSGERRNRFDGNRQKTGHGSTVV